MSLSPCADSDAPLLGNRSEKVVEQVVKQGESSVEKQALIELSSLRNVVRDAPLIHTIENCPKNEKCSENVENFISKECSEKSQCSENVENLISKELRVGTWNVLANGFCELMLYPGLGKTVSERKNLLHLRRRKPLISKTFHELDLDVAFLQECDLETLEAILKDGGTDSSSTDGDELKYAAHYLPASENMTDLVGFKDWGIAIVYKKNRLRNVSCVMPADIADLDLVNPETENLGLRSRGDQRPKISPEAGRPKVDDNGIFQSDSMAVHINRVQWPSYTMQSLGTDIAVALLRAEVVGWGVTSEVLFACAHLDAEACPPSGSRAEAQGRAVVEGLHSLRRKMTSIEAIVLGGDFNHALNREPLGSFSVVSDLCSPLSSVSHSFQTHSNSSSGPKKYFPKTERCNESHTPKSTPAKRGGDADNIVDRVSESSVCEGGEGGVNGNNQINSISSQKNTIGFLDCATAKSGTLIPSVSSTVLSSRNDHVLVWQKNYKNIKHHHPSATEEIPSPQINMISPVAPCFIPSYEPRSRMERFQCSLVDLFILRQLYAVQWLGDRLGITPTISQSLWKICVNWVLLILSMAWVPLLLLILGIFLAGGFCAQASRAHWALSTLGSDHMPVVVTLREQDRRHDYR